MDIGLDKKDRRAIATGLEQILSDTMVMAVKVLNYHWNVTGRLFKPLHDLFHDQYSELLEAADDMAERIRALGFTAPGSFKEFLSLTVIQEENSHLEATDMIERLVLDHETLIKRCKKMMETVTAIGDEGTVDILTQRLLAHGKMAWMLRSHLAG